MNGSSTEAGRTALVVPEEVRQWFAVSSKGDTIPPVQVREWLGDVIRKNYRLLYSIAYGFFENASSAEDLVQSAVLSGLQNLRRLRDPEAVLGWLAKITRNHCYDVLRYGRLSESLDDVNEMALPSQTQVHRFEEQRLVLAAIHKLPDKLAAVVRLRFLEECDIPEIASRLGVRRNTVDVRLHRALEQLAKDPAMLALKGEK